MSTPRLIGSALLQTAGILILSVITAYWVFGDDLETGRLMLKLSSGAYDTSENYKISGTVQDYQWALIHQARFEFQSAAGHHYILLHKIASSFTVMFSMFYMTMLITFWSRHKMVTDQRRAEEERTQKRHEQLMALLSELNRTSRG